MLGVDKPGIGSICNTKHLWIDKDNRAVGSGWTVNNELGYGQFRDGSWVQRSYLGIPLTSVTPVKIYAGFQHVAIISSNGRCFFTGLNEHNMFSDNNPANNSFKVSMMHRGMYTGAVDKQWKKLAHAEEHYPTNIAGLTVDNELYIAGNNQYGQLGNGTTTHTYDNVADNRHLNPTPSLTGVADMIVFGQYNGSNRPTTVVALMQDGTVQACGYGGHGQCGRGNTNSTNTSWAPVQERGTGGTPLGQSDPVVKLVTSGQDAGTCVYAITASGKLYGWGRNVNNNFGRSWTGDQTEARRIDSSLPFQNKVRDIYADNDDSMQSPRYLVTTDGDWYACGRNNEKMISVANGTSANFDWVSLANPSFHDDPEVPFLQAHYDVHTMWKGNGYRNQNNFIVCTNNIDPQNPREELWVIGYLANSSAAGVGAAHSANRNVNYESTYLYGWHQVPLDTDFVSKIKYINPRQYTGSDTDGLGTTIHLTDGSVWFSGYDVTGFVTSPESDGDDSANSIYKKQYSTFTKVNNL